MQYQSSTALRIQHGYGNQISDTPEVNIVIHR